MIQKTLASLCARRLYIGGEIASLACQIGFLALLMLAWVGAVYLIRLYLGLPV